MGTLAQLRARHKQGASADVFGDGSLHVEYDLARVTREMMQGLDAAKDGTDPFAQFDSLSDFLLTIGESWDLTEEDGTPIPFNAAELDKLGYVALGAIALGVFGDMQTKNWSALSLKTA
jgi:hypothetical protein